MLSTGLGEQSALNDLYEAELVFLASNDIECGTDTPCNLRRLLEGLQFSLLFSEPVSASTNPGSPDTSLALRRRRHLALTSFAAKGMTLAVGNITSCGPLSCSDGKLTGESAKTVALRTLATSSAFRWNEGDPIPAFEIFTPTGTDYQQTTLGGSPTTMVTLEFSQTPNFAAPATLNLAVPAPINNGLKGYFRFVPTEQQWSQFRGAAESSPDRRLYHRARLCLSSDPEDCVRSDQGSTVKNTTPFIQFGPGSGDNGCTCRQGAGSPSPGLWAIGALAVVGCGARRRRKA